MTCLLSAVTSKSNLKDEKGRMEPDKNGGFEMGTWSFPTYLYYFSDIAGKNCTTKEYFEGLLSPIEVYTPKAHEKIVKVLKELLKTLPAGKLNKRLISNKDLKTLKAWHGIGRPPVYPKRNPLSLNHRKGYERLLEIFESGEATVYGI